MSCFVCDRCGIGHAGGGTVLCQPCLRIAYGSRDKTRLALQSQLDGSQRALTRAMEEVTRLRSQRDRLKEALTNTVLAMRLWGSEEDGIPEAGPIAAAYDGAIRLLAEVEKGGETCKSP